MLKGIVSTQIEVTALFKENVDGTVGAVCPEIPGCTVVGRSKRDATAKIKAAVEGCLKELVADATERMRKSKRRIAGRD